MRKALFFFLCLYAFTIQAIASEQLVVLYSTSWCMHCKNAKAFLEAKKIDYTNYDIETSEIGRQKYIALKGKGIPLIYVGEHRIDGFDKPALESALKNYGLLKY